MGVEPYLTSSAVDCVIAQRLVRKLCERCKEPVEIEREILEGMEFPFAFARMRSCASTRPWAAAGAAGAVTGGGPAIYELMVDKRRDPEDDHCCGPRSTGEISRVAESQGNGAPEGRRLC